MKIFDFVAVENKSGIIQDIDNFEKPLSSYSCAGVAQAFRWADFLLLFNPHCLRIDFRARNGRKVYTLDNWITPEILEKAGNKSSSPESIESN
jgi:hypothetical protein